MKIMIASTSNHSHRRGATRAATGAGGAVAATAARCSRASAFPGPSRKKNQAPLKRSHLSEMNGSLARCSSQLLARRGISILFIVVCSLIIVNTRCDQVGGANEESSKLKVSSHDLLNQEELDSAKSQPLVSQRSKVDPLSVLREIYLDSNSKVITMLMPPEGDPVQKFHPNGRYGRRSVDNLAESHAELARLAYNEPALSSSSSSPPSSSSAGAYPVTSAGSLTALLHQLSREPGGRLADRLAGKMHAAGHQAGGGTRPASTPPALVNYSLEMDKLLECNYSGIANLFWCNSSES